MSNVRRSLRARVMDLRVYASSGMRRLERLAQVAPVELNWMTTAPGPGWRKFGIVCNNRFSMPAVLDCGQQSRLLFLS
jgi:hypothetical protein